MNLTIVPGMFVCSSLPISVCMFTVSKALLISSATVIVRAGGAIWLNPFATVSFSVCSAITAECCALYPCCMGVFGMSAVMQGRRLFSSVSATTERRDMGLHEAPPSVSPLGPGPCQPTSMCEVLFLLRAVPNILVRNASPRGPMCFRCLIFNLSGPCELLFLLCFIASWT